MEKSLGLMTVCPWRLWTVVLRGLLAVTADSVMVVTSALAYPTRARRVCCSLNVIWNLGELAAWSLDESDCERLSAEFCLEISCLDGRNTWVYLIHSALKHLQRCRNKGNVRGCSYIVDWGLPNAGPSRKEGK